MHHPKRKIIFDGSLDYIQFLCILLEEFSDKPAVMERWRGLPIFTKTGLLLVSLDLIITKCYTVDWAQTGLSDGLPIECWYPKSDH